MEKILVELKRIWPILLILFFGLFIFLKPTLYDMDSYYFASLSCHGTSFRPDVDSFAIQYIFSNIPCSLFAFQALLVGIFTLCVIISEKIGELIDKRYSQWLIYLFGISLSFYSYFARMEDDTIGMPFVFGSLYYLAKYSQGHKLTDFIIALGIIGVGFFFWKGIAIWGLIALCLGPIGWILSGSILWKYSTELIPRYYPNVSEELPLAGIASSGLVLLGGLFLPAYFIPAVSLSFMLAMLKLKYALYLGLLCSLGLYFYLCKHDFFEGEKKLVLGYPKATSFLGLLVIINLVAIAGVYTGPPSLSTVNLIHEVGVFAHDQNIEYVYNDWELGHLVAYNHLHPSNEYGPPTPSFIDTNGIIITHQLLNCPIINSADTIIAYDCRR